MFIRSERLFLRPGWPEEWEDLLTLIDDEEVVRNLARAPWPYTAEDAKAFAQFEANGREQDRLLPNFFITLPSADGARLIGSVGLSLVEREVNLGYWIGRPFWGRGYATEALDGAIAWASRTWKRRALVAGHFADNPASGRVLEKAGFLYTGEVRRGFSRARGADTDTRRMVWLA
jgi:RimJ/RimL family protein N-acetyltransferase